MLAKYIIIHLLHVRGVFKLPFYSKDDRRLNTVWYWKSHFWAKKCKGTFSWKWFNST